MKGLAEPDLVPLARYGRENDVEIRYTEFMPLDAQGLWDSSKVLRADEIIQTLSRAGAPLKEIPNSNPRTPATEYRYTDGLGKAFARLALGQGSDFARRVRLSSLNRNRCAACSLQDVAR